MYDYTVAANRLTSVRNVPYKQEKESGLMHEAHKKKKGILMVVCGVFCAHNPTSKKTNVR
jgi:hypothetical protein